MRRSGQPTWWLRWLGRCVLLWIMGGSLLCLLAPQWTSLPVHEVLGLVAAILVMVHVALNRWFFQGWSRCKPSNLQLAQLQTHRTNPCSSSPRSTHTCSTQSGKKQTPHGTLLETKSTGEISENLVDGQDRGRGLVLAFNAGLVKLVGWGLMLAVGLTVFSGLLSSQFLVTFLPDFDLQINQLHVLDALDYRGLHTQCANWLLVLVGLHLGLHAHTLWSFMPQFSRCPLQLLTAVIALHGIAVWVNGDYWENLTGQQAFSFWDYEAPVIWFFTDKLALLAAWSWLTYGLQRLGWYLVR